MSTGPYGQQGLQGAYGPRGITGAFGWGYGTTTGPTGPVGVIQITTPATYVVTMSTANASTLFRLKNASSYTDSNSITTSAVYLTLPTGLASSNTGQFWTFSNDLSNSLSLLKQGTSSAITLIQPYASTTFVYNGGSAGDSNDYNLF
jgi:hypothetical protein